MPLLVSPDFAPLLEIIDAAGLAAPARSLGDFDFAALVARRELDAMPAAPEAVASRLRPFGVDKPRRLFNQNGPDVYRVVVASTDVVTVWQRLSQASADTGFFPVVLGCDHEAQGLESHWDYRLERNKERPKGEHYLNLKPGEKTTWYGLRQDRFVSNTPDEVFTHLDKLDVTKLLNGQSSPYNDLQAPHGDWPDAQTPLPNKPRTVVSDWTHIALVPAKQAWEVPAFLPFFSGEGYPDQAELVAVAKHYQQKYGALVFAMNSGAEVELWVPQPLTKKEDAVAVAAQHFFFCPEELVDTVEHRAAELMQSHFWYFWWD